MKLLGLNTNLLAFTLLGVTFLGPLAQGSTNPCENALSIYESTIVQSIRPQQVSDQRVLKDSPVFTDPWLELGRQTRAWKDFKKLSDLEPINLSDGQRKSILVESKKVRSRIYSDLLKKGISATKAQKFADSAYSRWIINHLFKIDSGLLHFKSDLVSPKFKLKSSKNPKPPEFNSFSQSFSHIESMWAKLSRISSEVSNTSLLPTPFPMMVAGQRFNEGYYWDAYIGAIGLILTDRFDMAAAQLENFLHMIQVYGKVPNGFRQYYLGRSQPPVIPLLAQLVYDSAKGKVEDATLDHWWKNRVYPLLKKDYQGFWRALRFDSRNHLYFHDDNLEEILGRKDVLRPERHSNDDEYCLGETPRDVRAEAEYGRDHTDASMRSCSRLATVELNSLMVAYGELLSRMAKQFGEHKESLEFKRQSEKTKASMNTHLWDNSQGVFRNFHLVKNQMSPVVTADMFWTLHTGIATQNQANLMIDFAERNLEGGAGLRGSTADSDKQWDKKYYWAVDNIVASMGAHNYGRSDFSKRITSSFMTASARIYEQTGHFYEKVGEDQLRDDAHPEDDKTKYPTQTGFLWTNSYFVWGLKYLGYEFESIE